MAFLAFKSGRAYAVYTECGKKRWISLSRFAGKPITSPRLAQKIFQQWIKYGQAQSRARGIEIAGFFEYHTVDITSQRMQILLQNLANGDIDHKQILAEGGHGAYLRRSIGFDSVETIIATGPRRRLIKDMRLAFGYGAPLGDNMMTGTVGMLEALRRRKGLPEITYI